MIRLRIGGVPEHFNLPWRLAIEDGSFKREGIDLHWSDMTGGTGQMIRGLETGSLDIAVLLTEGISMAILKGLPAKILQVYVTSPLRWGIHTPVDSPFMMPSELESPIFAISREGSGSHLMAFVLADKLNLPLDNLRFNVVGDVYGGLWALENNKADFFLWEKFTTEPFVEQKKCKRTSEIQTPWPCFVIAVREEVYSKYTTELKLLQDAIIHSSQQLKNDSVAADKIAWRYNLHLEDARKWLEETSWASHREDQKDGLSGVVDYLQRLKLISVDEAKDWENKIMFS